MRFIKRFLALFPTKLPQGVTEFEAWAKDITYTYNMPYNDSFQFALATQILHLKSDAGYMPKAYFGKTLIKGAASQIAHSIMQDTKNRQVERAAKEELEKKQAEELALQTQADTTSNTVASDVG